MDEWIELAKKPIDPKNPKGTNVTNCCQSIGHVKHGFTWALHLLINNIKYKDGIGI